MKWESNPRTRSMNPLLYQLSYSLVAVGAFSVPCLWHLMCAVKRNPSICTRRHFDYYMPGIPPSVSLAMNQVLLKWANVGLIINCCWRLSQSALFIPTRLFGSPGTALMVNSHMLAVAVCAFRDLRIPYTYQKITEKKLRTPKRALISR